MPIGSVVKHLLALWPADLEPKGFVWIGGSFVVLKVHSSASVLLAACARCSGASSSFEQLA